VPFAVAVDSFGDVRAPAAACGVVGFRPTAGRYSRTGLLSLSESLETVAVVARTVEDVQLVDACIAAGRADKAAVPTPAAAPAAAAPAASLSVPMAPGAVSASVAMRAAAAAAREDPAVVAAAQSTKAEAERRLHAIARAADMQYMEPGDEESAAQRAVAPPASPLAPLSLQGLRVGVPRKAYFGGLDPRMADAVAGLLDRLTRAGAELVDVEFGVEGESDAAPAAEALDAVEPTSAAEKPAPQASQPESAPPQEQAPGAAAAEAKPAEAKAEAKPEENKEAEEAQQGEEKKLSEEGKEAEAEPTAAAEEPASGAAASPEVANAGATEAPLAEAPAAVPAAAPRFVSALAPMLRHPLSAAVDAAAHPLMGYEGVRCLQGYLNGHFSAPPKPKAKKADDEEPEEDEEEAKKAAAAAWGPRPLDTVLPISTAVAGVHGDPTSTALLQAQLSPDSAVPLSAYKTALLRALPALQALFADAFDRHGVDFLVYPTTPLAAAPARGADFGLVELHTGEVADAASVYLRNTRAASVAGLPCLTVPVGLTKPKPGAPKNTIAAERLPVGVELVARAGADEALLSLGRAVQGLQSLLTDPVAVHRWSEGVSLPTATRLH
jgi:Asp-tRNA(Asn)/Glu-tRNA(Gln) amidotransferase A subunit family amidase